MTDLSRKPLLASVPPPRPSRFAGIMRGPDEPMCPDGLIFDALEQSIRRWLAQRLLPSRRDQASRFMVIQGEPGTGKTVAACDAALRSGFHAALVSPATLASANEGGATAILDELIADMEAQSHRRAAPIVIVLNDFDLGIINLGKDTGHTVNTGLLIGQLQHYADNTHLGRNADGSAIGFIVTGNDFSHVRASLFRDRRATLYTHAPTADERLRIAVHVLKPEGGAELRLVEKLFRTYRDQSIAFWHALRDDLDAKRLDQIIGDEPFDELSIAEAELALAHPKPLDPAELWALAKTRATTRPTSFL